MLLLAICKHRFKLRGTQDFGSHAKGVPRQQLGLVVEVFTLVKDSDAPVLLLSQPTVERVDRLVTHSLGARGTEWAQPVTRCGQIMQRASGKHVQGRDDSRLGPRVQAPGPSGLTKQLVPWVLDRAVQTGGVRVVEVAVVVVVGAE